MGDSKLCLLLLLSTSALAFAQDEDQPTCLLAKRYKTLHKYEYRYEAESLNAINGASLVKNGPKASCTVEIEVPQTCSFIVRTTGCSLSEVVDTDAEGNPVFGPAPTSDAFAAEMEKYPLKVVVEDVYNVQLYPEEGETTTILNIKRGIISALAVPLLEEDKNKNMPTVHGKCRTYYKVNAREDIVTDISLNRDLSRCDNFVPMRDYSSPLALISGMHYPLAQLVRSSQTCNYKFDNEKKHMTSGSCTENHLLIPFSHKGEYGVTNVGKQEITLVQVSPHNDRVFDPGNIVRDLHMETVEDKSAVQDKDAAVNLLRELATLPETEGERRAHLFHKLVTMVRGMKTETLTHAIPEALAVSPVLTYQVLAQCGTPECSSSIMQILRTFDSSSFKVDATVFAMGLVSNPSALLINDMLEMAKYKPSKPIMYALSNVVKRFYKAEEKLIPEIDSVAEFMAAHLGDCSNDKATFMTLRVIGNMAPAVIPASPALRAAVIQCVNQPAASAAVQQAAIQVYRLTPVPEENRKVLMQVFLDSASPMQKRIAAYLVLIKDPRPNELVQLADVLTSEQNIQVKSFVMSHIVNILSSTDPETKELRQRIRNAMQDNSIESIMDPTKLSRNYKIGSVEGNMIFEGTSYLPREVMLDMTLKAFGFEFDMMEVGMEGKGFEPTVDALFGENGFFPDTALKAMYFVSDNVPQHVNEILQNILPVLKKDRRKRQNLMSEIGQNLDKLLKELKAAQSPEAMVYLRLLGNELGYLNTNEIEEMAYSAAMMIDSMFKMFPTDLIKAMMTRTDNTFFAHYIFMDNEFFLPTVTGFPLRIGLSGTFTPGVKGGLKIAHDMSEITFMPSVGIEFVTQVGCHIPEYVNSGLEMHTSIFHERGLNVQISMGHDQIKLTIPAPMSPTKLIKITNSLVAVTGSEMRTIPSVVTDKVDVNECNPVFAGMKYCTALQYTDAFSHETAPYFPFTGDSKFAVELHPTGEVTEYTATVAYELLKVGEEGRQKVDTLKVILRAEGTAPTEARAIMKYNRKKNVVTADIEIPDYDVEAGVRLGVVDGKTKGKGTHSISLDFINKNIPQLSLVGRANLKAMKEGMLQAQLLVPSINAEASVTANMQRDEELELKLETDIKFMDAMSRQKITIKYDASKVEVEVKSDVNTKTTMLMLADVYETYGNQLLDTQVGQTDMKVRHIFKKFAEAANNYKDKYGADIPYIQNFKLPDMPEISLPEKLYLNTEAKTVYYFSNEHITVAVPILFGGKSRDDLKFPPALITPPVLLPEFGLEIASKQIPIPDFVVPKHLNLTIPLFGKAEFSTVMRSNLYNVEATVAAGKDVVETPSYSAMFDVKGTSPFDILSIKTEGSAMVAITDSIRTHLKSSFAHELLEASISIHEDISATDKLNLKSSSKIEAKSPLGLSFALDYTSMTGINKEEISADNNFVGMFNAGPMYGKTTLTQSFTIFPFRPEAKIDSTFQCDSTIVKAQNTIAATLANGELSVVSNTHAFEDILTHVFELTFKDNKLSLKCDANALGVKTHHLAEASTGPDEFVMRLETNADLSENRVYTLLQASVSVNAVGVSSDATVKLFENEAVHKATLKINKDGLTTSGTTTLNSPLSLENTFNAGLDSSSATLAITNKAAVFNTKINNANTLSVTLSSLDFNSRAEIAASEDASYTHAINVDLKPYSASAIVNNNVKLLAAIIANEAQLKAEPYKMDLTGILKANYGQEEIKHTYQVNYADMTANAKCSTTGKLFGTHMNHNTELEIVGLAARLTNSAIFNSQLMRFDHSMHSSLIPFDFNVDAIFNVDGDITMHGKHSAQLYGKYILKAQPLAFASSLDSRSSVTQKLDNGFSLETTFDNKIETVLSIQEQKTNFRIRSKMNEHAFNQEMSVYNTPDRAGIEVSGTILTDILNTESTENQEFTISGFLKYDKNTDCHIILFPLSEHLPAFLEHIKHCVVIIAEALRDYINNEEVRAKLEAFPQHVINFVSKLNVESKIIRLKKYFDDITQRNVIYFEDFHMFLSNLMFTLKNILTDLTVYIEHFAGMIKQIIQSCNLHQHLIEKIHQELIALDEKYDIKNVVVYVIGTLREILQEMDLEELKGSSIEFLRDIDAKYEIKAKLENIMLIIKEIIERFDMQESAAKLKRKIEELVDQISTDTVRHIIHVTMDMIRDLDIIGMTNTFYNILRELIIKFEAEKKVQAILEKAVELIKQLRTEETVKAIVGIVKGTKIEFMRGFENIIIYLKSTEVKDIIQHLNVYIEETVENLNSLNYKDTVDFVNVIIRLDTAYLNELIRTLEIPQKLEATRDFINVVISSVRGFMEHAREVRIAEFIKAGKAVIVGVPFEILERVFKFADRTFIKLGIKDEILAFQNFVISCMFEVTHTIKNAQTIMYEMIQKVVPEQIIIKTEEIVNSFASETVGRILYYYVFQFNFNTLVDELFGDLKINFLPSMPEITIPEISLTEISFPTIPKIPVEKLVKSLAVPEMKLPTIPNEIMVPCFGKLYGEINFVTPIYTIKTSAEFHNSTENTMTPQFTGFITSQAESTSFEILNYKLDSTARIVMPKRIRVVLSETLKFNHLALGVEHQASLSIYGLSAQAQSKTNVKVTTTPYTANIENLAFIAVEEGMSGSLHTSYSHIVDLPALNVRSETKVDQKSTALQDGLTLLLKFENMGTVKFNGDYGKHISDMQLSLTPNAVKLSFSGNTDSTILKMKQEIAAEFGTLTFFKFNIRNEAESPVVKNSLLVASGHGSLHDMKAELKANHHTELYGGVTGTVTNGLTFVIHPNELVFEFQNKGNAKVNIVKSLIAKLELQNDYSAIFKPDSQQMNTVALVRLNQYKMFYNVTVDSNENEAGIFVAMENGANLDFLTYPISIPELALPFVDFHSPAINDLNLYEHTGLQNILITTEQTVDVDAKIVYQKKQAAPFFHIVDLIPVPRMGNLISELSFKSAIINLNVNTGLYAEDDFVFRLGAYTTSVFEGLKAKLHGTTSLTTQRGIKLANSLSLENRHIEGTQDITISMSTETSETAVSMNTVAKISLPILELEANQNLAVTTMTKTNAVATLMIKADFNIPVIKAVGNAKAGHSLKLDGTSEYISMETATKANMDGSVFEDYQVLGLLDNEVNLYLNHDGLRSTSKITADASLNHGVTKIIGIDVNEGLEVEASLGRVYAVMKYTGNNEANLFNFNTNGKHIAQATINLAPASSLNADVEIDITQPSSLGELTIFEKTVAEVTPEKQKISINAKFVSPLYTTNLASEVEGNDLVFKITLKSSATSPILLLEYDMDASTIANVENEALNMISKVVLKHADLNMDVNHVITQALSMSQHTLKLDITSPIFTDVNFRYDAHTDGVSASVSTPSSGFLGFQLNVQSLMRARVYGRYPSAPEVDIDILIIQLASVDADKTNMQIVYNMEAPKMFISELKMKLPSIISTVTLLADKYQITKPVEELKNFFVNRINEVYDAAVNYDNQMSQLSIFFSNIIVGYQKTVQGFLDAVIKVLRETQFKLPGSHEMTTLPEVLKKVVDSIAVTLDMVMQVIYNNIEVYYDSIRNIEFDTGDGGVITVDQILNGVKMDVQDTFEELIDFVKNMESLDTVLVELGETLEAIVEKSQEFVDSIKSDYLDAVFIDINAYYENLIIDIKNVVDKILNMEQLKNYFEYIMDMLIYVVDQFNNVVYDVLQQSSDKAEAYLKVNNGRLEIELPFPLKQ
ncbi:apolipoprotein Bb, tandem duplicate 1 [Mastacembelus armatus]|uniref:apolipoprotein Bb, tandem duplicate 1 n=1 Tax=Mastacembelus armatus TaxID=205130 RepID=UPI000E45BD77|nr:apolipoprotein B-100-like [Mastacembelus armatus]